MISTERFENCSMALFVLGGMAVVSGAVDLEIQENQDINAAARAFPPAIT